MANQNTEICTCTPDNYSSTCPKKFVQGATLLHVIDPVNRPRQSHQLEDVHHKLEGNQGWSMEDTIAMVDAEIPQNIRSEKQREAAEPKGLAMSVRTPGVDHRSAFSANTPTLDRREQEAQESDDQSWRRHHQEVSLPRFQPLSLRGIPLTRTTIGGYTQDVESITHIASTCVPLPPVALPITFVDSNLNFLHNFFSALESQLGQEFTDALAVRGTYSNQEASSLVPFVRMYCTGTYAKTDTQADLFLKRVLYATFRILPQEEYVPGKGEFTVIGNLYGFQYIEPGMRMGSGDLAMWLSSSYSQYRIEWNNAFKSTGIPKFARMGVQDRYEGDIVEEAASTEQQLVLRPRKHEGSHADRSEKDERRSRRTSESRRNRPEQSRVRKASTWSFGLN